MKIFIAIDSFKGCMTSAEANAAAALGITSVHPEAEVHCFTVSDGGEGFLDAMCPDEVVHCHVHDAMMRWRDAAFGIKEGRAVIETARAVGLSMIEPEFRNPLRASSYGVGELMVQALRRGCRDFIVGLGGSATSDCGLGMLKALKHEWQTEKRKAWYDLFDTAWLKGLKVTLATDVTNPLCGPKGAARVFAPQKGADEAMIDELERRAVTFSKAAAKHQGRDCSNLAGAGAAGGLGYAFMEFMDATVKSGADVVLRSSGFVSQLGLPYKPSLIITGEGSADGQTLMGKLPSVILNHGLASGVPVILLAGRVGDEKSLLDAGFKRVVNINEGLPMVNALGKEVALNRLTDSVNVVVSSI